LQLLREELRIEKASLAKAMGKAGVTYDYYIIKTTPMKPEVLKEMIMAILLADKERGGYGIRALKRKLAWGDNSFGQLSIASTDSVLSPSKVVDENQHVVGIFTMSDLNRAYSPKVTETGWYYDKDELRCIDAKRYMSKRPRTLHPDHTLKDAALAMSIHKIRCIPIIKRGTNKLCGIITNVDVLERAAKYL